MTVNAIDRCLIDGAELVEQHNWDGDAEGGVYLTVWFECAAKERHYYHAEYDAGQYIPTDEEFADRYPEAVKKKEG